MNRRGAQCLRLTSVISMHPSRPCRRKPKIGQDDHCAGSVGDQRQGENGGGGVSAQDGAGPSSDAHNSWGPGWGASSSLLRPDSSDLTLASELLGIPAVGHDFTAKVRPPSFSVSISLF